ncbi:hypothetical protein U1Q18_000620, partial [Sarracenia purpurea var. burkii]
QSLPIAGKSTFKEVLQREAGSSRPAFPDIIRQDEGIVSIGQELKEHGESNKSIKQSDDLVEIDTADEIPTVATAGMNAKDNTLISKLKQNKGKGASNWFDEE